MRSPEVAVIDERHANGDLSVARMAGGQKGLITTAGLAAAGLSRGAIARRVAQGRLHRVHRGVYLVGHAAPPPLARESAALLACGSDAVLSHRTAASLWGLLDTDPGDDVDVTIPGRRPRPQPSLGIHRVRRLDRRDVRIRDGLKVTSAARTLLDTAGAVCAHEWERAVAEAQVRRLTSARELSAVLERYPRRPGTAALRAMVDSGPQFSRSEAEDRFLALMRKASLPPTKTNARVGAYEVDFLWLPEKLVVEVDGFAYHGATPPSNATARGTPSWLPPATA